MAVELEIAKPPPLVSGSQGVHEVCEETVAGADLTGRIARLVLGGYRGWRPAEDRADLPKSPTSLAPLVPLGFEPKPGFRQSHAFLARLSDAGRDMVLPPASYVLRQGNDRVRGPPEADGEFGADPTETRR